MGNFSSKRMQTQNKKQKTKKSKEPESFFDRQKQLQYEREREKQFKFEMARNSNGRRVQSERNPSIVSRSNSIDPSVRPPRPPKDQMSYDQEMVERIKHQLRADANAFLLNNLMLSVQFFDNYERVMWDLKNNSVTESDRMLNDKMAQHHKHIYLPDKLQDEVHAHVRVKMVNAEDKSGRKTLEALQPQRMYVIHDNVEVNEPGEVVDYSTVLDAPYYRMMMEEDDEPGFVRLRKLDIIQNKFEPTENVKPVTAQPKQQQTSYSSSESDLSDESEKSKEGLTEGKHFMNELKEQIGNKPKTIFKRPESVVINTEVTEIPNFTPKKITEEDITNERRPSGILKNANRAVELGKLQQTNSPSRQRKRQKRENKKLSPNGSDSSGYKTNHASPTESSSESDYGYAKITAETTPKKLKISESAKLTDNTSVIPLKCITIVEVKKHPADDSDDDDIEEVYRARYGEMQRDLYRKMYYLNSNLFMSNFTDMFLLKLAHSLGFTADLLEDALTQGASIYCTRGSNKSYVEVLPSLNTTWPNMAQGWVVRRRNIIRNPRTSYVYQWPTQHMVGKAKSLGCLIVPLGFRPSRGTNKDMSLQWRLTFPAIERYLETCLAHSHVRCNLFATLLFKMFIIKNENSKVGLDYSHIRNHLFWQCEENYAMWPEDRLGETLRIFLKSFYQQMMKANMPDYFIPQCNLLKGIPKTKLLKQQRILADILESPVMHLISALKNLKYVKNNFYPVLNYKKLYQILTCEDVLAYINPNLPLTEKNEDEESDGEYHEDLGFWNEIKMKDPGYKWRKEQFRQHEAKKAAEVLVNSSKGSKESLDRKIILPSFMEPLRRRLILELFIPHFMSMAEYSESFQAMRQGIIYLEHAYRLSIVLRDEPGGEGQGREFMAIIREKIDILKSKVANTDAPKVPKRNESFNSNILRPGTSILRKAKSEQYINLDNVKAESPQEVKEQVMSSSKSMSSIVLADVHPDNERPKLIRTVSFQTVNEESENEDSDDGIFDSKL